MGGHLCHLFTEGSTPQLSSAGVSSLAASPLLRVPLRPSAVLQARAASQEIFLQEPQTRPEGISLWLTHWWWEVTSAPHNPACFLHSHSLVTHYFHSVARCCRDVPGALFPAGILVRPVGTAHRSLCTTQLVLTTSLGERNCIGASLTWQLCSVGPPCPLRPSTRQRQGRFQSPNKTF